jgi:hypothetical protein
MAVQKASTRQIALGELAKLNHLIEMTNTVEIRLPYRCDETSRDENPEGIPVRPTPASIAANARPVAIEQLHQMEQHLNKRLGMQFQYLRAMRSEIQLLRRVLIVNAVLFCGLLMWIWR